MPKLVDHDQYRKELLSQCLDVIADKGYAAITMRQMAQGLNVSTGTLYHYFPSKESLFEQLVEYISYQDTSELMVAELINLPTIAERIDKIVQIMIQNEAYFLRRTLMLIDFCRQRQRSEINQNQILSQAGQRYEQTIMRVLETDDPNLARLVLHVMEGMLIRRMYLGDQVAFADQVSLLTQLVTIYFNPPANLPN
ncbi:TetR/AcrR family transcriptional regulator [Pantanalinema sp. GBBB05]|uniref:TetR/AcrR family transcriptional regulator n=1 Tax=Pantanalinema sp. GBBB05 TaxID=2604139 RepID=UPI001D4E4FAF|nr:TetR/AcrR family transcriptional regulator [Pantanalinema sp. GBBB05]